MREITHMKTKILQLTALILSALGQTWGQSSLCGSAQAAYSDSVLYSHYEAIDLEFIFQYYFQETSTQAQFLDNSDLEALEERKEAILKLIGPDVFLNFSIDFLEGERRLQFIKWAIQKGANVNNKFMHIGVDQIRIHPLDLAFEKVIDPYPKKFVCSHQDIELIQSLIPQGAKCTELNQAHIQSFTENGMSSFLQTAKALIQAKHQHLNAQPGKEARIPYTMHHIWLTHPDNPTEIPLSHLREALNTKFLFESSAVPWTHILWTNEETLIPESIATLKEAGIEVKSIHDFKTHLRNYEKVMDLIESKLWGMASDILRYNLIHHFGGVYADLNFVFNRDVTCEAHTYDYFATTNNYLYQYNFLFGAKPNHPLMQALVEFFEKPDPSYLNSIRKDEFILTDVSTACPLSVMYYQAANLNGTIDVIYPRWTIKEEGFDIDEDFLMLIQKIGMDLIEKACPRLATILLLEHGVLKYEVCATAHQNIGDDSQTDRLSWLEAEDYL
jgi:hypothetical protein